MAKKLSSNLFKVSIAPENGADATTYWLVPSVTQVKRKADGSHLPEYVSCECFSKTGDGNPVSGGGTIKFVLTYKTGSNSAEFVYGSRIIVTSDMEAISFRLYVGGSLVDEKTVTVVEDGKNGDNGLPGPAGVRGRMPFPSGAFDLSTTYTATDAITPIVYYESGKTYYVMNKSVSVTGLNPAQDYAANGSNATWMPFENYKAIFTEILMANWAKLASAVFHGDYMFSQYGKDVNGNDVNSYELFDPTKIGQSNAPFTPNVLVDWMNGTMRLLKLIADGAELTNVKGLTGSFRSLQGLKANGEVGAKIAFDQSTSEMTFEGDIHHQGYNSEQSRSWRFFTSDLWCRGEFGHNKMTTMFFASNDNSADFWAHIYEYGTNTTYHKYAQAGQPIDCIVLDGSGNYGLFICNSAMYKAIAVVNNSDYPKRVIITRKSSSTYTLAARTYHTFITYKIDTSIVNTHKVNDLFW